MDTTINLTCNIFQYVVNGMFQIQELLSGRVWILNFMKIRAVGAVSFRADRQMETDMRRGQQSLLAIFRTRLLIANFQIYVIHEYIFWS